MKIKQKKKTFILLGLALCLGILILYILRGQIFFDYTVILPIVLVIVCSLTAIVVFFLLMHVIAKKKSGLLAKHNLKFSIIVATLSILTFSVIIAYNEPNILMDVTAKTVKAPGERIEKSYKDMGTYEVKLATYHRYGMLEVYQGTGDRVRDHKDLNIEITKKGWRSYRVDYLSDRARNSSGQEGSQVIHATRFTQESKPVSLSIFFIDNTEELKVPQEVLSSSAIMRAIDIAEIQNSYDGIHPYKIILLYYTTRSSLGW